MRSAEGFAQASATHGSSEKQEDREEVIQRLLNKVVAGEKNGKKKVKYLDDKALYDDTNTRHWLNTLLLIYFY